jgi:hypothetical protein
MVTIHHLTRLSQRVVGLVLLIINSPGLVALVVVVVVGLLRMLSVPLEMPVVMTQLKVMQVVMVILRRQRVEPVAVEPVV